MVILFAALFMALGLVNLDFGRNWLRGQLFRLAVGLPILLVYVSLQRQIVRGIAAGALKG